MLNFSIAALFGQGQTPDLADPALPDARSSPTVRAASLAGIAGARHRRRPPTATRRLYLPIPPSPRVGRVLGVGCVPVC
jgi:hypothetical protein